MSNRLTQILVDDGTNWWYDLVMFKPPEKSPVYAVISLADLLKVEREAADAGVSIAEAVRGLIVQQLLRTQASTVH